jgi:hypothetical protein
MDTENIQNHSKAIHGNRHTDTQTHSLTHNARWPAVASRRGDVLLVSVTAEVTVFELAKILQVL